MEALGTWLDNRDSRRPACGTGSPKPTLFSMRRRLCSVIPNCRSKGVLTPSTRRVCQVRSKVLANGPTHSQCSRLCASGNWESFVESCVCAGDLTRAGLITGNVVASLWPDSSRNTINHACKLLAMRSGRIAAWQMVSCPSDAKGRRYWEESVTWRCDEMWKDEYIKLSKEDYRNSTQWKRPIPGRPNYWERPFTRFLGDTWIPRLKACNTWTEWLSLKPHEFSSVCDFPAERPKKDHVMTGIPGMLHGHQIHVVLWRFWGTTRLLSTG